MREPLFDVIISVDGDPDSGEFFTSVKIVDRCRHLDGSLIGEPSEFDTVDDAIEHARGAILAFRGED
jgi:hypothetical protein